MSGLDELTALAGAVTASADALDAKSVGLQPVHTMHVVPVLLSTLMSDAREMNSGFQRDLCATLAGISCCMGYQLLSGSLLLLTWLRALYASRGLDANIAAFQLAYAAAAGSVEAKSAGTLTLYVYVLGGLPTTRRIV